MGTYDVVVVGAGPAGCTAAKAAAEQGMKTILIEEHPQIGIPEHCMGLLAAPMDSPPMQLVKSAGECVVYTKVNSRRIFTPDGKMVDKDFGGVDVVVIERKKFDLFLAEQAAEAGVEIAINTAATSLIMEGEAVKGVKTKNKNLAEINAKIVIASDGIRSLLKGIPSWANMTRPDQKVSSGLKWDLSGVEGLEEDILELHLGAFSERGFATLAPIGRKGCCLADMVSMKELETIKNGNWAISKRLKKCTVLRVTGFSHPFPMGVMLPTRVKEGLILAGDAGGFLGIDAAVSTGKVAGDVAGKAIKAGDVTPKGLDEYEQISHQIGTYEFGYAAQFHNLDHFNEKTDEEIQAVFDGGINL